MNTAIIDNTCDPCVVGAYHPPKPQYHVGSLLDYVEANVHEINHTFLDCIIILAGDFNQISYVDVIERIGLTPIVHQPTRGANVLDRIYVSQPCYSSVCVVTSKATTRLEGCRRVHRQEQVCTDKKDFN